MYFLIKKLFNLSKINLNKYIGISKNYLFHLGLTNFLVLKIFYNLIFNF